MKKEHLIHFFPFLRKEFRKLEENEIKSKDVFKELFLDDDYAEYKLKAVYEFQNCRELNILTSTVRSEDIKQKQKQKIKRNGEI